MKILKVIHGYPPVYSAGSEVYSMNLCQELARQGHQVLVFTREEVSGSSDCSVREDCDYTCPSIRVLRVNMANHKDRYVHEPMEKAFLATLEEFQPDVVHIGHLNHLSLRIPNLASSRGIPVIFTIHDFWMLCPRGQFIQMENSKDGETWPLCCGQRNDRCADRCYRRYFAGTPETETRDMAYWSSWVGERMAASRKALECMDALIAPSRHILGRFKSEHPGLAHKLQHLDYGFDLKKLNNRARRPEPDFVFGYIGTHTPAKGVGMLIESFARLSGSPRLRIYGRENGQETEALKRQVEAFNPSIASRIEWMGGYCNEEIVSVVFNEVDVIVVPSVWEENSPLVIHEAQQVRVPVITASVGGMAEFVEDGKNGLLFRHRNKMSLGEVMQKAVDDSEALRQMGTSGYLHSRDGNIPSIENHVLEIEKIYDQCLLRRKKLRIAKSESPWRVTFDTNPDDCNLSCIMCEDHSPHSDTQPRRIAEGRPRRRMDFDVIKRTIEELAPSGLREVIPSTMGEPLLYGRFEDILSLCLQHGVKLNLTTNGTFPRLGAEGWAHKIAPVCSDIKISWNGATRKTQENIMLGSKWEKVLENIRAFAEVRNEIAQSGANRCRMTLQLTYMEANLEELPGVIELASTLGIDRVKGHHLWAHFRQIEGQNLKRSPESALRWNLIAARCRTLASHLGQARGRPLLLENFEDLDTGNVTEQSHAGPCPFLGREAWVNAEGRFDPCCCPDPIRKGLGSFGSVTDGLLAVWKGKPYQHLLDNYHNHSVCRGCNMRRLS